ncbi:MAG: hypothetical protein ACI89L_001684 [Phycisphaerales bacterium]|jgi:hypothetical protein
MNRALRSLSLCVLAAASSLSPAAPQPGEAPVRMSPSQILDYENFRDLGYGEVSRFQDLAMPDGSTISLRLERFSVRTAGAKIVEVDAQGNEIPIGDNGLRLFKGSIEGNADSTVFIASSPYFTNGFIDDAKSLYAISSGKAIEPNALAIAQPIVITDVNSLVFQNRAPNACGVDPMFDNFVELAANFTPEPENPRAERVEVCRVVNIAIDTDYEYTNRIFGGNTNASSAYAETLLGAISTIYERDVATTFVTGFVRVFKNDNDPYTNSGDALSQVVSHWKGTKGGVERTLVHYLTGRNNLSYGGVAYLSALCDPNQGYGVSAYLNGSFPQPLQDNVSGNWDVVVMAHELGHNHGTSHTHDYSPQIDGCGTSDCSLAASGTIMSYCHTCSGGISNIRLGFHARVKATINNYLGNLPNCDIINPNWAPDALAIDDYAQTFSGIRGPIDVLDNDTKGTCNGYRPSIGTYDSVSANGGTVYIDSIPNSITPALYYQSPFEFVGTDTFTYTNSWGEPATVFVEVLGYRPPDIIGNVITGTDAEYFQMTGPLSSIPDTTGLTPTSTEHLPDINIPLSGGTFAGSGLSEQFAARFTGYFVAPIRAHYTFYLDSDDGSRLTIGSSPVVDHDGNHGYTEATGEIPLDEGPHAFTLEYFQATGDAGLRLSYSALGSNKLLVDEGALRSDAPAVNCPVDMNGDGVVDNGDIGAFIGLFLAADPSADFNGDAIIDNGDIGAFVTAFLAGC